MNPALVTEDTVLAVAASGPFPMVAFEIARRLHVAPTCIGQPELDIIAATARNVTDIVRHIRRQGLLHATPDGMVLLALSSPCRLDARMSHVRPSPETTAALTARHDPAARRRRD